LEEAVSGKSYAHLYQRLQDLIAQGAKVADAEAGTPATEIHQWISGGRYCLGFLEDKIPTAVADFHRIRGCVEFKVNDGEEAFSSKSAYEHVVTNPDTGEGIAGVLLDFRFDYLGQLNGILTFAATKIEIEKLVLSGANQDDEAIGKRLRAARKRAGQTQEQAAEEIKCDHKDISEWERGIREPHPKSIKKILHYIEKYSSPK
jgi:DNA-binding XRE family transcriptional regulator